jgi:hypothetical protein
MPALGYTGLTTTVSAKLDSGRKISAFVFMKSLKLVAFYCSMDY